MIKMLIFQMYSLYYKTSSKSKWTDVTTELMKVYKSMTGQ
jgi:hypothetical protein